MRRHLRRTTADFPPRARIFTTKKTRRTNCKTLLSAYLPPAPSEAQPLSRTSPESEGNKSRVQQASEKNAQSVAVPTVKPETNSFKRASNGLKRPINGHLNRKEGMPLVALEKKEEEHCKSCKGYLTPLVERIKMTKTAAL